jgi:two-component system, chemotaxis family, protein-glutamate methylesterase/glutaminase
MANRDVVAIGASAGGIEALQQILSALPEKLDAALLIVLHTSNGAGGLLPLIMQRCSRMVVVDPHDGDPIEKGKVYIAPPDHHMVVEGNILRILRGPRENLHRPAIDPLFRSAAASYDGRVIGVVLTGLLDDGTAGLMVIKARGGQTIVQNPDEALFSSMPKSALEQVPDAIIVPLQDIAETIVRLTREPISQIPTQADRAERNAEKESAIAEFAMSEIENDDRVGRPSAFACPDCGGVLWEIDEGGFLRFRCRVGHAFTARHLDAEQRHAVETALWSGLRALEESASLYRRMAERAAKHEQAAKRYEERAVNTKANAEILREFLIRVTRGDENSATNTDVGSKHSLSQTS